MSTLPEQSASITDLTPTQLTDTISLLVSLHLSAWPALSQAVSQQWGSISPVESRDKRDWFAGAISELITPKFDVNPTTTKVSKVGKAQIEDVGDLEEVLEQVMGDEFEVMVDDGSIEFVARRIWAGRGKILRGDFGEVRRLHGEWKESGGKGRVVFQRGEDDEGRETDWDEDDDEGSGEGEDGEWNGFQDRDGDAQMDEAPQLVHVVKEKPQPEVDEDGVHQSREKEEMRTGNISFEAWTTQTGAAERAECHRMPIRHEINLAKPP